MKMLIIEHDGNFTDDIVTTLKTRWPDCECFSTDQAQEGVVLVNVADPDLVILDLEAMDIDGINAIKDIRKISTVPLLVLSQRGDDQALAVRSLHYGADRFIKKPFQPLEFLARVNALLRRTNGVKYYRHEPDTDKLMVAIISTSEVKQSKEEDWYLETSSVN